MADRRLIFSKGREITVLGEVNGMISCRFERIAVKFFKKEEFFVFLRILYNEKMDYVPFRRGLMLKRSAILLLLSAILMMASSCSSSSAYGVWQNMCDQYPDQKGKVQIISNGEGDYHVEYEGVDYHIDKLKLFNVRESTREIPEGDVLVGWDSLPFGMGYLDQYYSYTSDDPVFIYVSRYDELYVRNDYDYETDTFVIDGSDRELVFSDMFSLSSEFSYDPFRSYPNETDITLYSKKYPRLQIPLRLFCVDDTWYFVGQRDKALFKVTDEFLGLLTVDEYGMSQ